MWQFRKGAFSPLLQLCCPDRITIGSIWKSNLIFLYLPYGAVWKRGLVFLRASQLKQRAYFLALSRERVLKSQPYSLCLCTDSKAGIFWFFSCVSRFKQGVVTSAFAALDRQQHLNPLFGSDIKRGYSKMERFQLTSGKTTRRDDRSHRFSIWKRRYRPR